MFKRLEKIENRYKELVQKLADPQTLSDKNLYAKYAKEYSDLAVVVNTSKEYKSVQKEIENTNSLLTSKEHENDKEFLDLATHELKQLKEKELKLRKKLENLLITEDGTANKNMIIEIRAGTGGDEAALFVADLYRMYSKYALKFSWKIEIMSSHPTAIGGFKEIVFSVQGKNAFRCLKYESGIHRVQRVPATETSGRIHTSAVSVAVLAEPEEVEVNIDPKDIKVDVYRATGPGGQGVNTTDSAVRITHFPTGVIVSCQDERSQIKNKSKAMRVLRARIMDKMQSEQHDKISRQRKQQVGTGDRSEKIRTYNFPDRRITDHRIGFTSHKLELILDGEMAELTNALLEEERKKKLAQWKED